MSSLDSCPGAREESGRRLWRSLDDLADSPEFRRFVEMEFPGHARELLSGTSRRHFLKVMGASLALAGMGGISGCIRWPREEIVPFANRPEGRTPGIPVSYATSMELGGVAQALLVTSYDGRPIKVEGNPQHPQSRGAASAPAQASVLGLYDPARSRGVARRQGDALSDSTWQEVLPLLGQIRAEGGRGLAILSEPSSSPSLARLRERLRAELPEASWQEYEPLSRDNLREGARLAFGAPYRPQLALDRAEVIVCLDEDLLMTHPAALRHAREFARGRRAEASGGAMNRLHVVESVPTVTGSMADHRVAVPSREVARIAAQLAAATQARGVPVRPTGPPDLASALEGAGRPGPGVERIARDLAEHRGRSLIAVGPRQPSEVHALVHVLNRALGNDGSTIRYSREEEPARASHASQIAALAEAMRGGRVDKLLILGGNPAFDAPVDVDFAGALERVPLSLHLSLYRDETSRKCAWHLPRAHGLESWGDARSDDGTMGLMQPLMEPLYGGRTPIEILSLILDEKPMAGHDLVRETLRLAQGAGDLETTWRRSLHDGFVTGSAWPTTDRPRLKAGWGDALAARVTATTEGLEAVFIEDHSVHDGRFANNGWLQELPDPMTKLAWDNAALIAPSTATERSIKSGDLLRLTVEGRAMEIAAFVMPGQAPGSITIPLGYGREGFEGVAGGVSYNLARGAGFDAYPLRTRRSMEAGWAPAEIETTDRRYGLATTQDHHAIDSDLGRETDRRASQYLRCVDLEEYRRDPGVVAELGPHVPHLESPWTEMEYNGNKWGMAIDLSACTGCSACVVACQAENNIGVTGKEEVAYGREMHWLRIDRYFRGDDLDNPQVLHQPVTCHQCENAPCEQVCPVAATVHNVEGLNDMVYNRCIGTRYCSNNCPYKVRRFNYFNNYKRISPQEGMAYNPEVTLRNRGVMEKCTYCVQRINRVKIEAKNERRAITDGEITPACAQTCPTEAIVFGDLNDAESRVARLQERDRAYAMLEELNVKPRTRYLAKLRNPPAQERS